MADKQYVSKIKVSCKHLQIETTKFLHFGRKVASSGMDLEEVNEGDKRAIGNWSTDVFGQTYSSKLPLAAMRVLSGSDTRRGFYRNSRTTFINEEKYGILAKQLFPWIEDVILYHDLSNKPTARGFLNMLVNMRWVILQDVAVMMDTDRQHIVFQLFPVFQCQLFKEFKAELIHHIQEHDKEDTDAGLIDTVLPGIRLRMDQQNDKLKLLTTENREYQQKVSLPNINSSVTSAIEHSIAHFTGFLGTYVPPNTQQSLIADDDTPVREQEQMMETNENSSDLQLVTTVQYSMPTKFDTVSCIIHHWNEVSEKEDECGHKWRSHLTLSDTKKFTRMKRIVNKINAKVLGGKNKHTVIDEFEIAYKNHKQSLSYLADKYLKICN